MIPLSTRMRPTRLEEFVGQRHFLYEGSLFYRAIRSGSLDSAIFFGPSGTGKTTLARIIAKEKDANFVEINASTTGTKELKEILKNASDRFYGLMKETTCLYVDEVHRWNKLQQDSLLKALEEGVICFIGSTTENPYFSVNNAILSRVGNIYEFKRLEAEDIRTLLVIIVCDPSAAVCFRETHNHGFCRRKQSVDREVERTAREGTGVRLRRLIISEKFIIVRCIRFDGDIDATSKLSALCVRNSAFRAAVKSYIRKRKTCANFSSCCHGLPPNVFVF